ncbi:MAG TPA: hypothetical protein VE035_19480 [Puia sp.]|nr:hypothetical protein [Puia sp.]
MPKIERSFGFRFGKYELAEVKTFGELCDIIKSKVAPTFSGDCTSQQAFYKLRQSIASIQSLEKNTITPGTDLEQLFPRDNRRKKIIQLRKETGFSLKILKPRDWISILSFWIGFGSFIGLFINWKMGLAGLALSTIAFRIANWLGKEFILRTVGEAADKTAREDYSISRRNPGTANQNEIFEKIKGLFADNLGLDPAVLTSEAPFN